MLGRLMHSVFAYNFQLFYISSILWRCCRADPDPIVTKGRDFVYSNGGSRFIIRGVNYGSYPQGTTGDYLSDRHTCDSDIRFLRELNINTILVSYIDPRADHAPCMSNFADNNIYVIVLLYTPAGQLDSTDGAWQSDLYSASTDTIDSLASFTNLLGFAVGVFPLFNISTPNLPFYKSALRDMKQYMIDRSYRAIPVGVLLHGYPNTFDPSGQDIVDNVDDYLQCDSSYADFVAPFISSTASYDNCKPQEHIDSLIARYANANLPTFISTIYCEQRDYKEIDSIYSPEGLDAFAGAMVAKLFDDAEPSLGLLSRGDRYSSPKTLSAFSVVASIMGPLGTATAEAQAAPTTPSCPTQNAEAHWNANTTLPPRPYAKLCSCMMDTLRCIATKNKESDLADSYRFPDDLLEVCESEDNCYGVWANGTTGEYGAFSVCTRSERYSWAANGYLTRNGESKLQESSLFYTTTIRDLPKNTDPDCPFLLAQVGSDGRGTLTATVRGTGNPTSSSTSTSSPGGGGESSLNAGGVSSKVKIGIAVGVVVGVALLLLIAALLYLRRRRKRRTASAVEEINLPEKPEKPEKPEEPWVDYDDTEPDRRELKGDPGVGTSKRISDVVSTKEKPSVELPAYSQAVGSDEKRRNSTDSLYAPPVPNKDAAATTDADVIHPSLR